MSIAFLATTSVSFAQSLSVTTVKTPSNVLMEKDEKRSATSSMKTMDTGINMRVKDDIQVPKEVKEVKEMGRGEMHRSVTASFVQTLIEAADRMNGMSGELRAIAQEQVTSSEKVFEAVKKAEKRGWITSMLIGSDYKNLGAIRGEMMTTENRIERLSHEMERVVSPSDRNIIIEEIQSLKDEQHKLGTFVKTNEDKFSLFGWAARLFQK